MVDVKKTRVDRVMSRLIRIGIRNVCLARREDIESRGEVLLWNGSDSAHIDHRPDLVFARTSRIAGLRRRRCHSAQVVRNRAPSHIFITASDEYACQSFE